ncbi:MAG: lysylphosphatidylglycerol synthase transmembrane domain-containing protein [Acidobacteriota bacterium]|nr:lysylphosphatidylglycerol synthase transmembrane domain-containing protein [Acidobacteriota bacterium]
MRRHFRAAAVIGLTVALVVFFLRSADWVSVLLEMRQARHDLVVAAFAAMTASFLVRVKRWQLLLVPLGRVGFEAAASATAIGFATNALLPGRLGEIVRPYLLARREHLGASAALATIVVERFLDLITIVLLLGVFVLFFGDALPKTDEGLLAGLKAGGLLAGVVAVVGLAFVTVAAREPQRVSAGVAVLERRLLGRTGSSVRRFIVRFVSGLAITAKPDLLLRAFGWSVVVWGFCAVAAWCTCAAFGILLPPSGSLLLTALMALGVAVPTPGGVGGFHAVVQVGLTSFFLAQVNAAAGVALVLHVVAFGPVTVAGLIWMVRDGVTIRGAVDLASSGRQDLSVGAGK